MKKPFSGTVNWIKEKIDFQNLVIILLLFWVARYWHYSQFGLYEDDLTIIPRAMQMNFSELIRFILNFIYHLYGHGRPLSDSFIYSLSNFGFNLAGLSGPYLIGFMIETINAVLFYFLMKRIAGRYIALLSTVVYVLFSADTTQIYLTHSLGLQPSLTLLLLAMHAYLSNKKWVAYLLSFTILFSYETPFLVFLGLPLLQNEWNRKKLKEWIIHCFVLFLMLVSVYLLRLFVGEGRVENFTLMEMAKLSVSHSLVGPIVSLGTYLYRPLQTIRALSLEIGFVIVITWVVVGFLLQRRMPIDPLERPKLFPIKQLWGKMSSEIKEKIRILVSGLLMLIAAYPLTFTVPARSITGRNTRVHSAGVIGASIIIGVILFLVIKFIQKTNKRRLFIWIVAGWFALVAGYGFVIQHDYIKGWEAQKRFWQELMPVISDVNEKTVVLVEPSVFRYESIQIGANYWNLPRVLNQIYTFPDDWNEPPRVYRLIDGWESRILTSDGLFRIDSTTVVAPPSTYKNVIPSDVILIQAGEMPLRSYDLEIGDTVYELKQLDSATLYHMEKGFLYPYLITSELLQ